ncbi:MAG: hypothetical protein FWF05_09075 [Oscillospiraceae bacterium]|nr:hypothetical protein [Oscillospiraceae bacterium]
MAGKLKSIFICALLICVLSAVCACGRDDGPDGPWESITFEFENGAENGSFGADDPASLHSYIDSDGNVVTVIGGGTAPSVADPGRPTVPGGLAAQPETPTIPGNITTTKNYGGGTTVTQSKPSGASVTSSAQVPTSVSPTGASSVTSAPTGGPAVSNPSAPTTLVPTTVPSTTAPSTAAPAPTLLNAKFTALSDSDFILRSAATANLDRFGLSAADRESVKSEPQRWSSYTIRVEFSNGTGKDITIYGLSIENNGSNGIFLSSVGDSTEMGVAAGNTKTNYMKFDVLVRGGMAEASIISRIKNELGASLIYAPTPRGGAAEPTRLEKVK